MSRITTTNRCAEPRRMVSAQILARSLQKNELLESQQTVLTLQAEQRVKHGNEHGTSVHPSVTAGWNRLQSQGRFLDCNSNPFQALNSSSWEMSTLSHHYCIKAHLKMTLLITPGVYTHSYKSQVIFTRYRVRVRVIFTCAVHVPVTEPVL